MRNVKIKMFIVIAVLTVAFAAITTSFTLSGSTKISGNENDYNVYYSNALVNGVQDKKIIKSRTELEFKATFDKLGQQYVLDYDVTNGSRNYDSELEMVCVGGNDYLSVDNVFNDSDILKSLETRSGRLTLELIKSYTQDVELEVTITCTINANALERDELGEGDAPKPISKWNVTDKDGNNELSIGDEISYGNEIFNVISDNGDTITMLAKNHLGPDFKQTDDKTTGYVTFSDEIGWESTPAPKDIDIFAYQGNAKLYVEEYVSYLITETNDTSLTGNLIKASELKNLDCNISDDYEYTNDNYCTNESYNEWLFNGTNFWTSSASPHTKNEYIIDVISSSKKLSMTYNTSVRTIRPTITISKTSL